MSAVEIRLDPSDLSKEMIAMRVWLDQHRFESSSFSCRDGDNGVLVSVQFRVARQAQAFAERFGGRAYEPSTTNAANAVISESLETGPFPSGAVG
jgi:hypothetical protein